MNKIVPKILKINRVKDFILDIWFMFSTHKYTTKKVIIGISMWMLYNIMIAISIEIRVLKSIGTLL